MIVRMMVKCFSNVVGLFKLLIRPSGGTPLGRVQRSTPGNRESKLEAIVVSAVVLFFFVVKEENKRKIGGKRTAPLSWRESTPLAGRA